MSGYVSRDSHSLLSNLVPVIASFDSGGHVKPLYVRINGEPLRIHSSQVKPSFLGTVEFECQVIDGEYLKPLSLTYHRQDCVWTIPKNSMILS